MESIDPNAFLDKFGAPIEQLDQLVKAKTVTISKLMELHHLVLLILPLVCIILPCMQWLVY